MYVCKFGKKRAINVEKKTDTFAVHNYNTYWDL